MQSDNKSSIRGPVKRIPKWIGVIILGIISSLIAGLIIEEKGCFSCFFPVSRIEITRFDNTTKTVEGVAFLSKNSPFHVLLYAGKAGGPYWLQGASGKLFSEEARKSFGNGWQATWKVPEIWIGPDVVDLRAVAILPTDISTFIAVGTNDPAAGNALKVESMGLLPECKKVSPTYAPKS